MGSGPPESRQRRRRTSGRTPAAQSPTRHAMLAGPPPPEVYQNISIANQLPSTLRLSPPKKFAEVGWLFSDQIINHDLLGYQQIIALMYENGIIELLQERLSKSGVVKIIEIGGGTVL